MSAAASVMRSDGSTAGALRALSALGPLQDQNPMLISIEAIRDTLGERWPSKCDSVWAQVDRFLRHQFGPEDLVLHLDELNALVVQPGRTRLAAQTRCIQAAYDLIRFFLGDSADARGAVKTVVELDGDQVTAAPIPPEQIAAVAAVRDTERWVAGATIRCPILTPIGRRLVVEAALAPILTLQAGRHAGGFAGYYVRTLLADVETGRTLDAQDRDKLRSCDLASIDVMVLGAAFTQRREASHPEAPLVVPVSAHTLAQSSARYALLEAARRLTPSERNSLALEIVDLEPGAPTGRICELVSIARPHCRGVICQLTATPANVEKLKSAGATLSLAPEADPTEATLLRHTPAYLAAAKSVHAVMLHSIPLGLAPAAALAGATHCTLAGPPPAVAVTPVRAT